MILKIHHPSFLSFLCWPESQHEIKFKIFGGSPSKVGPLVYFKILRVAICQSQILFFGSRKRPKNVSLEEWKKGTPLAFFFDRGSIGARNDGSL